MNPNPYLDSCLRDDGVPKGGALDLHQSIFDINYLPMLLLLQQWMLAASNNGTCHSPIQKIMFPHSHWRHGHGNIVQQPERKAAPSYFTLLQPQLRLARS